MKRIQGDRWHTTALSQKRTGCGSRRGRSRFSCIRLEGRKAGKNRRCNFRSFYRRYSLPGCGHRWLAAQQEVPRQQTDVSRRQVGSFPPYNESDLESESKRKGYADRFRAKWAANPVMHRAETDRNLTPTAQQITGNLESASAAARAQGRPVPVRRQPTGMPPKAERNEPCRQVPIRS
jgi:hypothetical protein